MVQVSTKRTPADEMIISYMTLRKWVGILGIIFAPVLVIGSFIFDDMKKIQSSLSAYYYTDMRNGLVGILCAIALFLMCYHGPERKDSIASKCAGILAAGIAFVPTSALNDKSDPISIAHYVIAALFFCTLSYMSLFLFTIRSPHPTHQKIMRNRVYKVCGMVMLIAVALIPIVNLTSLHDRIKQIKPTLVLETIALTAFGISWLTKGELLLKDKKRST